MIQIDNAPHPALPDAVREAAESLYAREFADF